MALKLFNRYWNVLLIFRVKRSCCNITYEVENEMYKTKRWDHKHLNGVFAATRCLRSGYICIDYRRKGNYMYV